MAAYQDDEGKVDAYSEVCDGQHIRCRQLNKLYGPDETLRFARDPADGDHHIINHEADPQDDRAVNRCSTSRRRFGHRARKGALGEFECLWAHGARRRVVGAAVKHCLLDVEVSRWGLGHIYHRETGERQ